MGDQWTDCLASKNSRVWSGTPQVSGFIRLPASSEADNISAGREAAYCLGQRLLLAFAEVVE